MVARELLIAVEVTYTEGTKNVSSRCPSYRCDGAIWSHIPSLGQLTLLIKKKKLAEARISKRIAMLFYPRVNQLLLCHITEYCRGEYLNETEPRWRNKGMNAVYTSTDTCRANATLSPSQASRRQTSFAWASCLTQDLEKCWKNKKRVKVFGILLEGAEVPFFF